MNKYKPTGWKYESQRHSLAAKGVKTSLRCDMNRIDFARATTTAALSAREVRNELKKSFPGIKFSVRSDTFSMGDSVDVDWIDGPSKEEVDKVVKKYQYGHFDGMTDMYEISNDREDLTQTKYVMTSRKFSPELTTRVAQVIAKDFNIPVPKTEEELNRNFQHRDKFMNYHDLVYYYCYKLSFVNGKNNVRQKENFSGIGSEMYEAVK